MLNPNKLIFITILIIIVCFGVLSMDNSVIDSTPSNYVLDDAVVIDPKFSTWMWESPSEFNSTQMEALLDEAADRHIETIFLNVEEFINIYESKSNTVDKDARLLAFDNSMQMFIRLASERNISVWALTGASNWVESSHIYLPPRFVEYVNTFNAKYPTTKFAGIQFDIEYYNSEKYKDSSKKNKTKISADYLDMVSQLERESEYPLGFAIPYWFNRQDSEMRFDYNNSNATVFEHLIDILGSVPNSEAQPQNHLAVMSYRRKTLGNNGTIDIVSGLFSTLQNSEKQLTLYLGQDTATSDYSMSFAKNEWIEFLDAAQLVNQEFGEYGSFGGIAVHHLSEYLLMEEE